MEDKTLLERVGELRTTLQSLIADAENEDANEEFCSALRSADDNLSDAEEGGSEPEPENEE